MPSAADTPTPQPFRGRIAGVGSTSGIRVVVGRWHDTPLGPFGDAMVETPDGHRVLLAPHREAADFIAATYRFDEVRLEPFDIADPWRVRSPSLTLDVVVGRRTLLGTALRCVPTPIAVSAPWSLLTDLVARAAVPGVRTRGSAGNGRRERYGATDNHRIDAISGSFDGVDLGALSAVDPPPRFGFSSTPRSPSVTALVTTIDLAREVSTRRRSGQTR